MVAAPPETDKVASIFDQVFKSIAPPPRLTVSQWADQRRILSPEDSAEPGKFRTDRAPYQRGMMDALNEPGIKTVVFKTSAQVGKTNIMLNVLGYFMDLDPCPIMCVLPTLEMAEDHSKRRIAPMLRDTPVLKGLVKDPRARDSGNTLLTKQFPGGQINLAGANSPASLASRSIRVVVGDELDRWPRSAGTEGDPWKLLLKRQATYWNAIAVAASTPTIKDASRIDKLWEESDQRHYLVPCPHCNHPQKLEWDRLEYPGKGTDAATPSSIFYRCSQCEDAIDETHKYYLLTNGKWVAHSTSNGVAGFHVNELYSPWRKWSDIAADYESARTDPLQHQVWVNTSLGESFELEESSQFDWQILQQRAQNPPEPVLPYKAGTVPQGGLILTAGVDVQDDRLETSIWAWGRGEQAWMIQHYRLLGDPRKDDVWKQLDDVLLKGYKHESGITLHIKATCVDTGYLTHEVYGQLRARSHMRYYAIKGSSSPNKPLVNRPKPQDVNYRGKVLKRGIKLYEVGVDIAKETLLGRAKIQTPGNKYLNFPSDLDSEWFEGLCSEVQVRKHKNGIPYIYWQRLPGVRNEPLDTSVYALAAASLAGVFRARWTKEEKAVEARLAAREAEESAIKSAIAQQQQNEPEVVPLKRAKTQNQPRPRWIDGY